MKQLMLDIKISFEPVLSKILTKTCWKTNTDFRINVILNTSLCYLIFNVTVKPALMTTSIKQ